MLSFYIPRKFFNPWQVVKMKVLEVASGMANRSFHLHSHAKSILESCQELWSIDVFIFPNQASFPRVGIGEEDPPLPHLTQKCVKWGRGAVHGMRRLSTQ